MIILNSNNSTRTKLALFEGEPCFLSRFLLAHWIALILLFHSSPQLLKNHGATGAISGCPWRNCQDVKTEKTMQATSLSMLGYAVLGCAVLGCAVLRCAVLGCAVLGCAVLGCAVLGCAHRARLNSTACAIKKSNSTARAWYAWMCFDMLGWCLDVLTARD